MPRLHVKKKYGAQILYSKVSILREFKENLFFGSTLAIGTTFKISHILD